MARAGSLVVLACLIIGVTATDSLAFYNPGLGCWMQRDPGRGGVADAPRVGTAAPAVNGRFMPRDQYADGMNLYGYVASNPVNWVDWTGNGKEKPGGGAPRGGAPAGSPATGPVPDLPFTEAHFLHSVGTYPYAGQKVGHTGIGCKHKDGTLWVFDYVGGGRYRNTKYDDWVKDQAGNCDKGCKFKIEDMLLGLTKEQANSFCSRLAAKRTTDPLQYVDFGIETEDDVDMGWDWQGRGGDNGHNCNSSVTQDMGATTPIQVPEQPANFWGLFIAADYYNRWGKHTAPWLRSHGHVSSETTSEHDCIGGGSGAGHKK